MFNSLHVLKEKSPEVSPFNCPKVAINPGKTNCTNKPMECGRKLRSKVKSS